MTLPGPIAEAAGAAPAAKPDRPAAEELCQLVRELLDLPAELTPGLECIEHIDVAIRLCRPRAREPKILNSAIPYLSQISRRRVSSIATPGTIITITGYCETRCPRLRPATHRSPASKRTSKFQGGAARPQQPVPSGHGRTETRLTIPRARVDQQRQAVAGHAATGPTDSCHSSLRPSPGGVKGWSRGVLPTGLVDRSLWR